MPSRPGVNRIAEYDGSNALQRRYVFGPGVDQPIVWYEGSGASDRRFLSSDERGSIISLTDSAGALVGTGINRYDEYGNPQSTNLGAFGYTGQAWLQGINVWYYKARAYDPELGRFLQTDPIGYEGGINLYAYVGNDPINLTDSSGNCVGGRICEGEINANTAALKEALKAAGYNGTGMGLDQLLNYAAGAIAYLESVERATAVASIFSGVIGLGSLNYAGSSSLSERPLDQMEQAFFALQFPDYVLSDIVLVSDMPWWVDESRFAGITLDNRIYLRDGIGSLLSSADRAEFGGHELGHAWQYSQGMSVTSYVVAHMIVGYDRNPAETAADLMGLQSRRNYCSVFHGLGC